MPNGHETFVSKSQMGFLFAKKKKLAVEFARRAADLGVQLGSLPDKVSGGSRKRQSRAERLARKRARRRRRS